MILNQRSISRIFRPPALLSLARKYPGLINPGKDDDYRQDTSGSSFPKHLPTHIRVQVVRSSIGGKETDESAGAQLPERFPIFMSLGKRSSKKPKKNIYRTCFPIAGTVSKKPAVFPICPAPSLFAPEETQDLQIPSVIDSRRGRLTLRSVFLPHKTLSCLKGFVGPPFPHPAGREYPNPSKP